MRQAFVADPHRVERPQRRPQRLQVPVLGVALGRRAVDVGGDHVADHVQRLLFEVLALQDAAALGVDHLALLVHHLVVLEDVLSDLEVLLLDLGLGALDGAGHHLVLDRHVVGQVQPVEHRLQCRAVEAAHQLVAQRQIEARLARVALPAGATAQLVVDAPRLVALGAQHVQAAGLDHLGGLLAGLLLDQGQLLVPGGLVLLGRLHRIQAAFAQPLVGEEVDVAAQHDVGAAAGHVGGDGDAAAAARHRDDARLLLVVLGVEHVVRDAALLELPRQVLRALHAGGADQDRLALLVALGDVVDHRDVLGFLGLVDQVRAVGADHRLVGRDGDHPELVDLVQLGRLGLGGAGHAGELVVEPEVVLQRDGGQRLVLGLDLDVLLGLDGLVHALVVAAADQHAAGELVDDEHLAVADDVVLVAGEQLLGLQRVVEVADQRRVGGLVEVVDAELVLDELHALFVHADGALAQVDLVVGVLLHQRCQPGELEVPVRRAVGGAGDDQRGAGLVDQDRVDLVDDRVGVPALHQVVERVRHVVAQVVEAELVVGPVGDVGVVGDAPLVGRHLRQDDPDLQAQEAVHPAHPLAVALGQVVVDGDDMDALAAQRVEVGRQHAGQGLALTGLHLGDVAQVQRGRAHHLHVERALVQHPPRGLAGHGERLGQQVVEGLPLVEALAELVGLGPQLRVGELLDVVGQRVDIVGHPLEALDHATFTKAQQLL